MSKSDKTLTTLVREIETLFGGNLSMVAVTFEKGFKNASHRCIDIVLKTAGGGEFSKLAELESEDFNPGILTALDEVNNLHPSALVPLFTDCRVLYGSKEGLPKISRSDVRAYAAFLLTETLTSIRQLSVYDEEYASSSLQALYADAAFAVSYIYYLENGKFIAEFSALKNLVSDREYIVLDTAENWSKLNNAEDAVADSAVFLEKYCRFALEKLSVKN